MLHCHPQNESVILTGVTIHGEIMNFGSLSFTHTIRDDKSSMFLGGVARPPLKPGLCELALVKTVAKGLKGTLPVSTSFTGDRHFPFQ